MADLKKREREVILTWIRDKKGGWLPRPPPNGTRAPNGLIWANKSFDFYRLQRAPGVNVVTAWSLSMIKEFNENFHEVADEYGPEPDPKLYLPFPWLRLPQHDATSSQVLWRSIQGVNREGGILRKLDAFDPSKPIQFGNVYKSNFTLEEFIPATYFPDILIVNDPKGITEGKRVENSEGCTDIEATPRKYKRVWPIMDPTVVPHAEERQNVAHLNFAGAPLLGRGHHSAVHRASLKFPADLEAYTGDGSIGVAAKIAFPNRGARRFLRHEAETYNRIYGKATDVSMDCINDDGTPKMPTYKEDKGKNMRHLMEHWSGFCLPSPYIRYPVPVTAVVPKFFGYYVPTDEADEAVKIRRGDGDGDGDSARYWQCAEYSNRHDNEPDKTLLSPILLVEDCGTPIDPQAMGIDDRTECLSFLVRLSFENMAHNSFFARNILVQPGPLDVAPPRRSMKTPSYRIIDLGRAEHWDEYERKAEEAYKQKHGKELEKVALPIGNDGYVRTDIPYEGAAAERKRISFEWSLDKDDELKRAKEELLFDDIIEPNINGMVIEILG